MTSWYLAIASTFLHCTGSIVLYQNESDSFIVQHAATIDEGRLEGTIKTFDASGQRRSFANASMKLVDLRSGEVKTATTNSNGGFQVDGLNASTYALIAQSSQGFIVQALRMLDGDQTDQFVLETNAAPVSHRIVCRSWNSYRPTEPTERNDAPQLQVDPSARPHENVAYLDNNGTLRGQLHQPLGFGSTRVRDMNALVVSGGQIVARTITDAEGRFSISGLRPGTYGLIAAGRSGFASVGFEAQQSDELHKEIHLEVVPHSVADEIGSMIDCDAADPNEPSVLSDEPLASDSPIGTGTGGGATNAGGPGSGGGGGGGGGGAGGAGLAAAGLAAAAAAAGGGGGGAASNAVP